MWLRSPSRPSLTLDRHGAVTTFPGNWPLCIKNLDVQLEFSLTCLCWHTELATWPKRVACSLSLGRVGKRKRYKWKLVRWDTDYLAKTKAFCKAKAMQKSKTRIYQLRPVGRQVFTSQESQAPSHVTVTQEDKCVTLNVALAASPLFLVHPSLVGGVRSKKKGWVWALLSNNASISVTINTTIVFSPQIQNTAPYLLLWWKLTLFQPKPPLTKVYTGVRSSLSFLSKLNKPCDLSCSQVLPSRPLHS